jgi:hypothetical protein
VDIFWAHINTFVTLDSIALLGSQYNFQLTSFIVWQIFNEFQPVEFKKIFSQYLDMTLVEKKNKGIRQINS